MLNEIRGLEYTLEILRVLHLNPGEHGSRKVHELVMAAGRISASLSYIQKVLQRMVKAQLLISSEHGYQLSRPLNELTLDMALDICDLPVKSSPTYALCVHMKKTMASCSISKFYDFNTTAPLQIPDPPQYSPDPDQCL